MLRHGVARMLIDKIPLWMGGIEIVPSKQDYKRIIDLQHVSCLVNFNDDRWDFREGFRMHHRSQNIIHFSSCHEDAKKQIKGYAVKCIDEGTKISTLHTTIRILIQVINAAIDNSQRKMLLFLTTGDIITGIDETQRGLFEQQTAYRQIIRFIEYLAKEEKIKLCIDLKTLKKNYKYISDRLNTKHQRQSYPDIPEELFDELITMFNRVMRDKNAPLNDSLVAGIMLINSQLGLRKSEICALETDFYNTHYCDDGIERPYIVYNCIKAAKGDVESIPFRTICTDLCKETIKYYMTLREKCIYANETDFLFIQDPVPSRKRNGQFPISTELIDVYYKALCTRYIPEIIKKDWKGIRKIKAKWIHSDEYVSIPSIHSFRVHFASSLYKAGFPLDYIECAMSHSPNSNFNECYYGGVQANGYGRVVINDKNMDAFEQFINIVKNDTETD